MTSFFPPVDWSNQLMIGGQDREDHWYLRSTFEGWFRPDKNHEPLEILFWHRDRHEHVRRPSHGHLVLDLGRGSLHMFVSSCFEIFVLSLKILFVALCSDHLVPDQQVRLPKHVRHLFVRCRCVHRPDYDHRDQGEKQIPS